MRSRLSRTRTRFPARARYAAQVRPLCPAPTTMASQREVARFLMGAGSPRIPSNSTAERLLGKETDIGPAQLELVHRGERLKLLRIEQNFTNAGLWTNMVVRA